MNLYHHLARSAERTPGLVAVHAPDQGPSAGKDAERSITFGELHRRAGRVAGGLRQLGVGVGDRVVMMVPVSRELYVVVGALFRLGAVPVLMDPWMGLGRMAACIRHTEPTAFVGIPAAHALFLWRPGLRGLTRVRVGGDDWMGGHSLERMAETGPDAGPALDLAPGAPAMITFTGGSTGAPKGVLRSHDILDAQHRGTAGCMGVRDGDVHMQTFPNMVMSNIASGVTSVIPRYRQGHPADADPAALLHQALRHGVTGICGPPALLVRLADHCLARGTRLRRVRRVVVGGCAVGFDVVRRLERATRPGAVTVLYGSSEAEPLATLSGRVELRRAARAIGRGGAVCVGRPPRGLDLELMAIPPADGPVEADEASLRAMALPPGQIGELVVRGDHVCRGYYRDPAAERELKIHTSSGRTWHRLGDTGYLDAQGRVYLVGRTGDAVARDGVAVHPLAVEPVLDALPFVRRSGVVGLGDAAGRKLVVAIEIGPARGSRYRRRRVRQERVRAVCRRLGVEPDRVVEVRRIPVDRRHNGKVDHEALARICRRRLVLGRGL